MDIWVKDEQKFDNVDKYTDKFSSFIGYTLCPKKTSTFSFF